MAVLVVYETADSDRIKLIRIVFYASGHGVAISTFRN